MLPLAPVIGRTPEAQLNGVKLWIRLGPVTFQPVEIAKLLLVIFFASYFVEKREMLSLSTRRVGNRLMPDLRPLGPITVAWVVSLMVILFEHDIGFSLLLFVMFITMLWVATGRWTYVAGGLVAFVAGTFLAAHLPFAKVLIDQRVGAWINPWAHYGSYGYQTVQGEIALGRGGLTGSGLGLGSPFEIPVAYSDFIFAAIGEELGLLGTTAVVVGFLLLVGAGIAPRFGPVRSSPSSRQLALRPSWASSPFSSWPASCVCSRSRACRCHLSVTEAHRCWRTTSLWH